MPPDVVEFRAETKIAKISLEKVLDKWKSLPRAAETLQCSFIIGPGNRKEESLIFRNGTSGFDEDTFANLNLNVEKSL